jgi:hypothetical protein
LPAVVAGVRSGGTTDGGTPGAISAASVDPLAVDQSDRVDRASDPDAPATSAPGGTGGAAVAPLGALVAAMALGGVIISLHRALRRPGGLPARRS